MAPSACELLSGAEEFDFIAALVCPLEDMLRLSVYPLHSDDSGPSRFLPVRAYRQIAPVDVKHRGELAEAEAAGMSDGEHPARPGSSATPTSAEIGSSGEPDTSTEPSTSAEPDSSDEPERP